MLIATSKNAIILYTSALTGSWKLEGFSSDHILAINDVDIVKQTMGNDAYMNTSVVVAKVEGTFSFFPNSPTLNKIDTLQSAIYLSGQPNDSVLTVIFPSLLKQFVYADFQFLSAPKGIEARDEAQPRVIKWGAQLPNVGIASAALQTVLSLL